MKTATQVMDDRNAIKARLEQVCRAAYDNRYHKTKATIGYDEFRSIWFKAMRSDPINALVHAKFTSGNDIPVTRITIDRSEVEGLL